MIRILVDNCDELIWIKDVVDVGVLNAGYYEDKFKRLGIDTGQTVTYTKAENYDKNTRNIILKRLKSFGVNVEDEENLTNEELVKMLREVI